MEYMPNLNEPVNIGTRRELMVDRFLIDQLRDADLCLQAPVRFP